MAGGDTVRRIQREPVHHDELAAFSEPGWRPVRGDAHIPGAVEARRVGDVLVRRLAAAVDHHRAPRIRRPVHAPAVPADGGGRPYHDGVVPDRLRPRVRPEPRVGGDRVAVTVTATQGGSTGAGMILRVMVLTQAAAVQNGATSNTNFASPTTTHTQSITTTQTGSRVYGVIEWSVDSNGTAAANSTLIDNVADSGNQDQYVTFKATSTTGTPGATTL